LNIDWGLQDRVIGLQFCAFRARAASPSLWARRRLNPFRSFPMKALLRLTAFAALNAPNGLKDG